jgi:hypothetical protein
MTTCFKSLINNGWQGRGEKMNSIRTLIIVLLGAGFFANVCFAEGHRVNESDGENGEIVRSQNQHKGDTGKGAVVPSDSAFYLWAYHPGSGYVNGFTFKEASTYCSRSAGLLADKQQLIAANESGLSLCAYGWLSDGQAGYVMRGTHSGCGNDGWNSGGFPKQSRKFGAYCVGENPRHDVPDSYKFQLSK